MTNGDYWRDVAEKNGRPLRTLEQVKATLERDKKRGVDVRMARLMLRHGRMTDEARSYVAREYPQ